MKFSRRRGREQGWQHAQRETTMDLFQAVAMKIKNKKVRRGFPFPDHFASTLGSSQRAAPHSAIDATSCPSTFGLVSYSSAGQFFRHCCGEQLSRSFPCLTLLTYAKFTVPRFSLVRRGRREGGGLGRTSREAEGQDKFQKSFDTIPFLLSRLTSGSRHLPAYSCDVFSLVFFEQTFFFSFLSVGYTVELRLSERQLSGSFVIRTVNTFI